MNPITIHPAYWFLRLIGSLCAFALSQCMRAALEETGGFFVIQAQTSRTSRSRVLFLFLNHEVAATQEPHTQRYWALLKEQKAPLVDD